MRLSEQHITKITGFLASYSNEWRQIGVCLGFTFAELDIISASHASSGTALFNCLSAMLSKWGQWAPGDARGHTDYATLDSLKEAVDKAGLGRVAQELHNLM